MDFLFEFQAASTMRMSIREFRRTVAVEVPSTLVPMHGGSPQPAWLESDIRAWLRTHEMKRRPSVVYFIEAVGLDRVKIGWTVDLAARLEDLRCASPAELTVIGQVRGSRSTELELHRRFAEQRVWPKREWFVLSGPVREYLDSTKLSVPHSRPTPNGGFTMTRKTRVTDGVRTRDSWSHNPTSSTWFRCVAENRCAALDREKPRSTECIRPRGGNRGASTDRLAEEREQP